VDKRVDLGRLDAIEDLAVVLDELHEHLGHAKRRRAQLVLEKGDVLCDVELVLLAVAFQILFFLDAG